MAQCVYLGHVVDSGLVKPEPTKIQAVQQTPPPQTKSQVRTFLGLTGYMGRSFTIQTDHRSLEWLDRLKDNNARLTCWSLALQPYQYSLVHRPGKKNVNANALSHSMKQKDGHVTGQGGGSMMDCLLLWFIWFISIIYISLLMSSIGFSIFGYFCRLGYCVVHVFPLTLLLLYKVEQVHTFATKTVGSCVLYHH